MLERSATHILFIKDECTFRFSNFLMVGLCNNNYSANSWCDIFSFLIPPSEVLTLEEFLSKNLLK